MILIHQATFSWAYWYRHTRKSQYLRSKSKIESDINNSLNSNFLLEITGLETFIYNRSLAYDLISERLKNDAQSKDESTLNESDSTLRNRKRSSSISNNDNFVNFQQPELIPQKLNKFGTTEQPDVDSFLESDHLILKILPIEVRVTNGSVVVGNHTTPYLLVSSYSDMSGHIDASLPSNPLDLYQKIYEMKMDNVEGHLRPNIHYQNFSDSNSIAESNRKNSINKFWEKIIKVFLYNSQNSNDSLKTDGDNSQEWNGLKRYIYEFDSVDSSSWKAPETKKSKRSNRKEYAKESNVFSFSQVNIIYYFDMPGLVSSDQLKQNLIDEVNIGNGGPAPKFGLDLIVSGAKITYGPWAEKNRVFVHQVLFPTLYKDSEILPLLSAGQVRQYTKFEICIDFVDSGIMRIPFREESKEDKIKINDDLKYSWFDINVEGGSSMNITIPSFPNGDRGFENRFVVTLVNVEVNTNVNGSLLFKSSEHIIEASVGYPLQWDGLANWSFNNTSKNIEIYLLREHVTFLSDLIGDFGSGDPTPSELFRPFIYTLNWKFQNYSVFLNINEQNIIDNPLDHGRNRFLKLQGEDMDINVCIPNKYISPKANTVDFKIFTSRFTLSIEHPEWSTYKEFSKTQIIGEACDFEIDGSYKYYTVIEKGAVDTIVINCKSQDTTLKVYGFVIKYFLDLKENYFGNLVHFKTYEEYTRENRKYTNTSNCEEFYTANDDDGFPTLEFENIEQHDSERIVRNENETDFLFSFCANNGCIILPCHIYDSQSHIALHFDNIDVDIRNNNYYMDLQGNISEIKGRYIEECNEDLIFTNTKSQKKFKPDIFIDGLVIHSIRIFGLPPQEQTYFCRWTIDTDGIIIDSYPIFLGALDNAIDSFIIGYHDPENTLDVYVAPIMDILNFKFKSPFIKITLTSPKDSVTEYSASVLLKKVGFCISDQPTPQYNSRTDLTIEEIIAFATFDNKKILHLETSLTMTNFCQKKNGFYRMLRQTSHLKDNDGPFHRTPFLIPEFQRDRIYNSKYGSISNSIYLPDLPIPLTSESVEHLVNRLPEHVKSKLLRGNNSWSEIQSNDDDYITENYEPTNSLKYFSELYELEKDREYDNLIVEMKKIEIFVSPGLLVFFTDFERQMYSFGIFNIFDDLQVQFLKNFKFAMEKSSMSVLFQCNNLEISLGESKSDVNGIVLSAINPEITFCAKLTGKKVEEIDISLNVYALEVDVFHKNHNVIEICLNEVIFGFSKSERSISKLDVGNLDISMMLQELDWIVDYLKTLLRYKTIYEIKKNELKIDKQKAKLELLYQLTKMGIENGIISDPECLSKVWNQSKKESVRRDKNWRILPRLRHILNSLPENWVTERNEMFKSTTWEAPADANNRLQTIFANWRVWERRQDDVIAMVFDNDEELKNKIFSTTSINLKKFNLSILPFADAIILQNILFEIHEDKLSQSLSDLTHPLLDMNIENSMDIKFNISSIETNFTGIRAYTDDLLKIIEKFPTNFEDFGYNDKNVDEFDSAKSVKNFMINEDKNTPWLITLYASLDKFDHIIGIDKSRLHVIGSDSTLFTSIIKTDQILSFSLMCANKYINFETWVETTKLLSYTAEDWSLSVINTKPFGDGDLVVFVKNEFSTLSIDAETNKLLRVIDHIIYREYPVIKVLVDKFEQTRSNKLEKFDKTDISSTIDDGDDEDLSNFFEKLRVAINLNLSFNKLIFNILFLSSALQTIEVLNNILEFKMDQSGLECSLNIERASMITEKYKRRYLSGYLKALKLSCSTNFEEGNYLVDFDGFITDGIINLTHNDLIMILSLNKEFEQIKLDFNLLQDKFTEVINNFQNTISLENLNSDKIVTSKRKSESVFNVNFNFKCQRVGIWLLVNGNSIQFEFNRTELDAANYNSNFKKVPLFGGLDIPSSKIFVKNGLHGNNFTLMDLNLHIAVLNPENPETKLQELHVTSEYSRLALKTQLISEMIDIYGELCLLFPPETKVEKSKDVADGDKFETLDTILSFFAINIRATNFCLGWIIDEYSDLSGLILGFENSTVMCNNGSGSVSMKGMYLSIANGSTSETFYSISSEIHSKNRVFLPGFELKYTLSVYEGVFMVDSRLDGDKVDFRLQIEIFQLFNSLMLSWAFLEDRYYYVQHKLEDKIEKSICEEPVKKSEVSISDVVAPRPLKHIKRSFHCEFSFGGASILIQNQRILINGVPSSLGLTAPQLMMTFSYIYNNMALKKHSVMLKAVVGETYNTLRCTCVPVIVNIVQECQMFMRQSNKKFTKANEEVESSIDFVSFSEKVDANFDLKIEPQKLVLDCDPRAQIEAEVISDTIRACIITAHDRISGVFVADRIRAELKHAFSKVISGSIGVEGLSLSSTLAIFNNELKFVTVASLKDISGYINIQQRQDLDVFKDLWFPGELYENTTVENQLALRKKHTFGHILRDVSTTVAFPWVLNFYINHIEATVDLGTSLGILNVEIDGFKTSTSTTMNWDHDLKLFFENFVIKSKGKLEGSLVAVNTELETSIQWKKDDNVMDIPIVSLSFGFESLETKILLDYHPFFIAKISYLAILVYNERALNKKDKLTFDFKVDSIKLFMTAMTASNFVEIYSIGLRISQNIKISYKQTLDAGDASIGASNQIEGYNEAPASDTFLNMIAKLKSYLNVQIGAVELMVFPSSLTDSQSFVVKTGLLSVEFLQDSAEQIENQLVLKLSDIYVSLSTFKEKLNPEYLLEDIGFENYVCQTSKSNDDHILIFPSLRIAMNTWQNQENNIVKYTYGSEFGDKIDIKWKLGSVYFIHQLWVSHATTLKERLSFLHVHQKDEAYEENYKESVFEAINFEDKLKEVESDEKYIYEAIQEVIIETPQLKDLGEATPPLEWFGLHRNKFPNLTHQFVIIGLQKCIEEAEEKYSRVLK
ncbi:Csf1 protein [Martiniozyma asiatica (nom. inval.)]|nr:Csf1 protein [Martiniozyma asiatica]